MSTDKRDDPLPDPDLRDQDNMALLASWFDLGEEERVEALRAPGQAHLDPAVRLHAEDAWIDDAKTKVGVEVPFTRHWYRYVLPRPLTEIDAESVATEARIRESLAALAQ